MIYVKEYFHNNLKNFDIEAFLPKDEYFYLKQIFYLVMSVLLLIGFLALFLLPESDLTIWGIDVIVTTVAIVYVIGKKPWGFVLALLLLHVVLYY